MSEFVDVEWFGCEDKIGIVLTYDEFDGFKCRMAPIPTNTVAEYSRAKVVGPNEYEVPLRHRTEQEDIDYVMANAAKIPFEWAWGIFGKQMKDYYLRNNLNGEDWPLTKIRYDHRDYDVETLQEVK